MYFNTTAHSFLAKVFHWGFIAVFSYGLINQVDEVEELEDAAFLLEEMVFAILFLIVLLARFIYMRSTRRRAVPGKQSSAMLRLARVVHNGIYASLTMLALSGLLIGGMYALAVKGGTIFGLVLWLHEACYWTSVNLIALHIVGAIYHRYLGDGVWSSMVPLFVERPGRTPTS